MKEARRMDVAPVRMDSKLDGSMLRTSSSSWWAWRGSRNAFRWSAREDDDEEGLRWAAIQKLPTYDRMRKGILTAVGAGGMQEVDILGLSMEERKCLIERLIRIAEDDNESFLLKLRERMERVGIQKPTIEVRFEHLTIDTEVYVGKQGVPTFTNFFSNKVMDALSALRVFSSGKRPISILHNINGIVRPNRMSLLLGAPGSGKTSLLLALAGKLDPTLLALVLPSLIMYHCRYFCLPKYSRLHTTVRGLRNPYVIILHNTPP